MHPACRRVGALTRLICGESLANLMLMTMPAPVAAQNFQPLPPFQAPNVQADEGEVAVFEFVMPVAFNFFDVRYAYAKRDGTAKAGENYRAMTGHVVFPACTRKATVRIRTHEDADLEDQHFELRISDMQARGVYAGPMTWNSMFRVGGLPAEKTVRAEIRDTTANQDRERHASGHAILIVAL
ncbi:MAG: hypothetical protein F4145_13985 [Boseongicola sp. SB0675_bin_26]|nr:hypothetical protein [Boseongicola sp. SB0675_bin_26]